MGIPIWTAAQARRETLSRAIIRMQDISESIEICNAADLILAICQTEEEKEKKIYRLFVAGHREGAMGMSLVVRGDPTRMMVKDFIVESPDR